MSGYSRISWLLLAALLSFSTISIASEDRVYRYHSKNGTLSFSDIEPIDTYYEEVNFGCYACGVYSEIDWLETKLYPNAFADEIEEAARYYRVDANLVRAIIHAESHFRVNAISKQGAQGLMQLMPATARELGVRDPFTAKQNIQGGVKHLAKLMKKYYGNIRMVSAAYNAGEGNVKKYNGIPPFEETKVYIERVEILHKRYGKLIRT
ncbi:lytic transglycosylase domain-containing protein [Thalassotalea sp. M1531]|uniref:Lytic transglycosylase domain-containing protein n=1 Tax=Thalassotalea algicola TaxID=2716224 RepID=A0A7Y0LCW4_9GAMM|nr:lytic transglycosylase domain-containing protein [Thalassotalea algicola]NMP31844.1 lytic transglycosylase domain-containing protein [Thalassotalea algicola]